MKTGAFLRPSIYTLKAFILMAVCNYKVKCATFGKYDLGTVLPWEYVHSSGHDVDWLLGKKKRADDIEHMGPDGKPYPMILVAKLEETDEQCIDIPKDAATALPVSEELVELRKDRDRLLAEKNALEISVSSLAESSPSTDAAHAEMLATIEKLRAEKAELEAKHAELLASKKGKGGSGGASS